MLRPKKGDPEAPRSPARSFVFGPQKDDHESRISNHNRSIKTPNHHLENINRLHDIHFILFYDLKHGNQIMNAMHQSPSSPLATFRPSSPLLPAPGSTQLHAPTRMVRLPALSERQRIVLLQSIEERPVIQDKSSGLGIRDILALKVTSCSGDYLFQSLLVII